MLSRVSAIPVYVWSSLSLKLSLCLTVSSPLPFEHLSHRTHNWLPVLSESYLFAFLLDLRKNPSAATPGVPRSPASLESLTASRHHNLPRVHGFVWRSISPSFLFERTGSLRRHNTFDLEIAPTPWHSATGERAKRITGARHPKNNLTQLQSVRR